VIVQRLAVPKNAVLLHVAPRDVRLRVAPHERRPGQVRRRDVARRLPAE
jgi:hypothetical protein